ncbi:MAG: SDR family NAD(P)-dependent oxidoreductase [Chromatiales bacterium]|nr:SDR family NAD(P)-dependent oxidoreductase [Chromatiales bacterium]
MPATSILITGCSTGIGYSAAVTLKKRGYRVFATARKDNDLKRLSEKGLEVVKLDMNSSQSIAQCFSWVMQQSGGTLDALFNNSGYGQVGAIEDVSRDHMRLQFETNFFGWHELTSLVIPVMRRQGYGRIIQNGSGLGLFALPLRGAYTASKHALEGWTDTLRLELAGTNIKVSIVEPGPIDTPFRQNSLRTLENIDIKKSFYSDRYEQMKKRLMVLGPAVPFTLPPEAVVKKLIHALESKHPRPRYRITFPVVLFWQLRKLLGDRLFDRILLKVGQ